MIRAYRINPEQFAKMMGGARNTMPFSKSKTMHNCTCGSKEEFAKQMMNIFGEASANARDHEAVHSCGCNKKESKCDNKDKAPMPSHPFISHTHKVVPVNISEYQDKYLFEAFLPGASKEEIDFSVCGDKIVLKYSPKSKECDSSRKYIVKEKNFNCSSDNTVREFVLPDIDVSGEMTAKLENGVLRVELPKNKQSCVTVEIS